MNAPPAPGAEWIGLPQLCNLAHSVTPTGRTNSALHATVQLMDGLQVNVARMQENLTLTAGLIFAAPSPTCWRRSSAVSAHTRSSRSCAAARATPGELAAVFSAHRDVAAAAARTRYYLDHRNRTDG
jgi:adenylosuccinate lyase